MIKFLEQIFCDGSIVKYKEDRNETWVGGLTELRRTDADGSMHKTTVKPGYLQSKVDLLRQSGNGHKILRLY